MQIDVAVIGGTGIGDRLLELGGEAVHIPTSKGMIRGRSFEHSGRRVLLLSRHSAGHKVAPHNVNYLGMSLAVQHLGAKFCFSTAATGGLIDDWPVGTMAVCSDFIDATGRNLTHFDRAVVHTDFTEPFGSGARASLLRAASELGIDVHDTCIYVNGNGPRYETPYEIQLYRRMGGHVVGMTAASEAIAMRELGIDYGCLTVVTNLAAGLAGQQLNHAEVVEEMTKSGETAVKILLKAIERLPI
ncbi:MAG: MTAP family purine nucleoside phosphorylase [Fimbriimonadaceae bacterium]|nr:MTAP family purine nucleoside phosphorylase [Fimbriimonadaceae bacterium]